ncbi:MAG: putative HTH-type transcriptional regulator YcbG [Armatimonadota bacterium]|nr:MAG: putative HTH-type transcriptional regulator YcbG [Armatimonadota bacterium]
MSAEMSTEVPNSRTVIRNLIQFIRENQMRAGDRLPAIPRLAAEWKIKPSVVRDGLLQAESLGLVSIHPRLGTFVQQPDLTPMVSALSDALDLALIMDDRNLVHLGEARLMVEREVVALAAERAQPEDLLIIRQHLEQLRECLGNRPAFVQADEDFHVAIARAAGNPIMTTIIRALLVALRPYRQSTLVREEDAERIAEKHVLIYQALTEGDPERAQTLMEEHFVAAKDLIRQSLGLQPVSQPGTESRRHNNPQSP